MPKRIKQTTPVEFLENTDKSTAAEIEQRVTKVYELLVNGATRRQIIQYANSEKVAWNVSDRTLDTYIADARTLIEAEAATHRAYEFGKALTRVDDIYARSAKVQDYQRALAANDQRNKLLGLYPPQQVQITHLFEKAGVTVELVTKLLDALQTRGIAASDVFNSMIAELSKEDVKP